MSQFKRYAFLLTILILVGGGCATQTTQPETIAEAVIQEVTASLVVDDYEFSTDLKIGSTALDLMKKASEETDFVYGGQEYEGMGFFVSSINGVEGDTETNTYWIYYINDESAMVGISQYELLNNDVIEWKYEESTY